MRIADPGIYDGIPAADYHADPCLLASLSSSLVKILCTDSPAHAKAAHPRLNPGYQHEDAAHFDIGTAAHAILLEGADIVTPVDAPDWRTKIAQAQRDDARAKGKVPLLVHQLGDVNRMIAASAAQLAPFNGLHLFSREHGKPEQTIVWCDEGVWCRARADWLHDDHRAIDDYKTTSVSANPDVVTRTLFQNGWDIQVAFYLRGLRAVGRAAPDRDFRFVVQETKPPYALSVIGLAPDALVIGEKKVLYALETWKRCLQTGAWPGYPNRVCYATVPSWHEAQWLARELGEGGF